MTKNENLSDPNSCWNKAKDDEPIFILRGKDSAAEATIVAWTKARVQVYIDRGEGLPYEEVDKLVAALKLAGQMKEYQEKLKGV